MDAQRFQEVKEILYQAEEITAAERTQWLYKKCGDDKELFEEVRELLEIDEDDAGFIDQGAFNATPPSHAKPDQLGPYLVESELGSGGMGSVYLASRIDGAFQRKAAIKVLHPGMDTELILARFESEKRIHSRLTHPNIVTLFDSGSTQDLRSYLVMEFVEGKTLMVHCRQNQLSIEKRIRLFITICEAVHFAHRNLVIHRDLKPTNILITADGGPKLLDFGIARLTEQDQRLTKTGLMPLTPAYASPEQARGEHVSTASDVYSLGVILFQLLTGRRPPPVEPISGERQAITKPSQTVLKHEAGKDGKQPDHHQTYGLPSKSRHSRRLQGELDNIISKALSEDPSQRYASAQQFAEDLSRHLNGFPILAKEISKWRTLTKLVKRHRLTTVTLIILTILPISFTATRAIEARETEFQRIRATQQREIAQREAAVAHQNLQFLLRIIKNPDPNISLGQEDTLEKLILETEQNLDIDNEDPLLIARQLKLIAQLYSVLGLDQRAEATHQKAQYLTKAQSQEVPQ